VEGDAAFAAPDRLRAPRRGA